MATDSATGTTTPKGNGPDMEGFVTPGCKAKSPTKMPSKSGKDPTKAATPGSAAPTACSEILGLPACAMWEDGSQLLPYSGPEFLDYGPKASSNVPGFIDEPDKNIWDPSEEPCVQESFNDYTGADSLGSAGVALLVFVSFQFLVQKWPN